MIKLRMILAAIIGMGMMLQIQSVNAQAGATTKPPAAQSTTSGGTAKPPAAKPSATGAAKPAALTLKDDKEKTSYALGMNIAHTIKAQPIDLDQNAFMQGVKDILAGNKTLLSEQEMAAVLAALQADMNARAAERRNKWAK